MGSPFNDVMLKAYYKFCNKSCPIMWAKDNAGYDGSDEIHKRHCEKCIIPYFLRNEFDIDI